MLVFNTVLVCYSVCIVYIMLQYIPTLHHHNVINVIIINVIIINVIIDIPHLGFLSALSRE